MPRIPIPGTLRSPLPGRLIRRKSHKTGMPPGSLVPFPERPAEPTRVDIIDYSADELSEVSDATLDECTRLAEDSSVTWINVEGTEDTALLQALGSRFGLHPLLLEDLLSGGQRPKLERYDNYLFVVLRMLTMDETASHVVDEQVALVIGSRWVLSFQERQGDVFEPIRNRIRSAQGRIRQMGPGYLAYSLLDAVVDHYFVILESFAEMLDGLEAEITGRPTPAAMHRIHRIKREMVFVRRAVWPLREAVSGLQREESPLIGHDTQVFVRDLYDHTVQAMDALETFRDMAAGLLDTYLSTVSYRTNEVMKVLTMMATIFIPLTFIAGVYGMNFDWMPELTWRWGYPAALGLMLAVSGAMIFYFKRKDWL